MGKVNVVIVDATGNKEQKVGLPDDIKCGIIMVKLVEKIKLPSVGPDGNPISYKFIHKVTGRQLLEAQTLGEAGIKDGDVLRLQPEITAGAVCTNCGNAENDGNSFCSRCGSRLADAPKSAPVNNAAPNPAYNTSPAYQQAVNYNMPYVPVQKKKASGTYVGRLICSIIGIVTGAFATMFGIAMASGVYDFTYLENYKTYNSEAYTGIQNATIDAVKNIHRMAEILDVGLGLILIFGGIITILFFVMSIINARKN